ncbi:MAG: hydrolase, partial [Enterobacter roggenkampii]
MVSHPPARRSIMSRIALINIDTQQSFHHRNYWQESEIPAF